MSVVGTRFSSCFETNQKSSRHLIFPEHFAQEKRVSSGSGVEFAKRELDQSYDPVSLGVLFSYGGRLSHPLCQNRHWTVKVATYQDFAGNIATNRIEDLTEN